MGAQHPPPPITASLSYFILPPPEVSYLSGVKEIDELGEGLHAPQCPPHLCGCHHCLAPADTQSVCNPSSQQVTQSVCV